MIFVIYLIFNCFQVILMVWAAYMKYLYLNGASTEFNGLSYLSTSYLICYYYKKIKVYCL